MANPRNMITPQQIEQISFGKATFGGYSMEDVDEFLEPLTEDYVTLYKENTLLKSKMRVLVGKLEEYRKNEASMKDAIVNAQKTCDLMVKEAEEKCKQMLTDAGAAAAENSKNAVYDYDKEPDAPAADPADAVADEIAASLEALVGTTEDPHPKAEPKHPAESTTTSKFANLKFGPNYDPTAR